MSLLDRLWRRRARPGPPPVGQWFRVSWDDEAVVLDVSPPGHEPWKASFPWSAVSRVCFKAEGLELSDGVYVFTSYHRGARSGSVWPGGGGPR